MGLKEVQEVGEFMIDPIELTYFDTCEVWRMADVEQPNGSIKQQRTRIYTNIPCGFSQGSSPSVNSITEGRFKKEDDVNKVQTKDKLFLNPSYLIQQGDKIVITHYGRTLNTTAGFPFIYDSHQVLVVEGTTYA